MNEEMAKKTLWTRFQQHDQKVLLLTGLFFLLLAIGLTIREIDLGMAYALAIGSLLLFALSLGIKNTGFRIAVFSGVTLGAILALAEYAIGFQDPNPAYLLTPLVLLLASLVWVVRLEAKRTAEKNTSSDVALFRLVWIGLTVALVAVSWSGYYHYISNGLSPEFHLRRLVLTGFWIICGLVLYVAGRNKFHPLMPSSGMVFIALASLKALLYDTSHLEGFDRIWVLVAMGLVLSGASLFLKKHFPKRQPLQPQELAPTKSAAMVP